MKRKEILAVYHQGPEAVVHLVETLLLRIGNLEARIQALELNSKKTPKTATNHLLPMSSTPKPKSLRLIKERKPGGQEAMDDVVFSLPSQAWLSTMDGRLIFSTHPVSMRYAMFTICVN